MVFVGNVQVLVTTMHQTDEKKYYDMNLSTDAVIANQSDIYDVKLLKINVNRIKLVTTATRGTSVNRNIAIANAFENDDYILFADDDLVFYDNYNKIVAEEFKSHPQADAIKFNVNSISERKISMKPIKSFHKATRREIGNFGVCGMAIKKEVLDKISLGFNERFGPGTENYCGEDSIFYQELLKRGVALYVSPIYISDIDQSESTWFEGHNDKFFTVGGMIMNECYPFLSFALAIRSAFRMTKRKTSAMGFFEILKCYYKGIFKNIYEKRNLTNEYR